MSDYFANRYWAQRYWTVRYFQGGEQAAGAMSAGLSGSAVVAAALSYTAGNPVVVSGGGGFTRRKPVFSLRLNVNPAIVVNARARLSGGSALRARASGALWMNAAPAGRGAITANAAMVDYQAFYLLLAA